MRFPVRFLMCVLSLAVLIFVCSCSGPDDTTHPLFQKGLKERKQGNYEASAKCFLRFLTMHPDVSRAHLELASLYETELDSPLQSIYHYKMFMTQAPDAASAADARKLLATVEKRYYMKMKVEYNDPEDLETLKTDLFEAGVKIKKLERENGALQSSLGACRKHIYDLTAKNVDLQQNIRAFRDSLSVAQNNGEKLRKEFITFRDETAVRQRGDTVRISELVKSNTEFQKKAEQLKTDLAAAGKNAEKMRSDAETLRKSLDEQKRLNAELNNKVNVVQQGGRKTAADNALSVKSLTTQAVGIVTGTGAKGQ